MRRVKALFFMLLSVALAYSVFVGFEYTFDLSILALVLSIYDYDIPKVFFGDNVEAVLGRKNRVGSRVAIALACATSVFATSRLASALRYVMFPVITPDLAVGVFYDFYLFGFLGIGIAFIIVHDYIGAVRKRRPQYEEQLEQFRTGSSTLLLFGLFLGSGGEIIITSVIIVVVPTYAFFLLAKVRRPKDVVGAARSAVDVRGRIERNMWVGWFNALKSPQNLFLVASLVGVTVFSIFNLPFLDLSDSAQLPFVAMMLLSLLLAYYGLRRSSNGWAYCIVAVLPLYSSMLISWIRPDFMPLMRTMSLYFEGGYLAPLFGWGQFTGSDLAQAIVVLVSWGTVIWYFGTMWDDADRKKDTVSANRFGYLTAGSSAALCTMLLCEFLKISIELSLLAALLILFAIGSCGWLATRKQR